MVDVSAVGFIDSGGLKALLASHGRAKLDGLRFIVVSGSPAVDRMFALTDVKDALTVVKTLDEV